MPEPDLTPEEELPPAVREALQELRNPQLAESDRQELLQLIDEVATKKNLRISVSVPPFDADAGVDDDAGVGDEPARPGLPQGLAPLPPPPEPQRSLEDIASSDIDVAPRNRLPVMSPSVDSKGQPIGGFTDYWYDRARNKDEPQEAWRARNDQAWQERMNRAQQEGQVIKRQSATSGLENLATSIPAYLAAPLIGVSQGLTSGALEQPVRWLVGEQALQDIRDASHSGLDVGSEINEAVRGAGEIITALNPRSLSNRITGKVMGGLGALDEAAGAAHRWLGAAAAGGVDSVARSAIDAAGAAVNGVQTTAQDALDAGEDALYAMGMSGMLAPIMEGAQALGFGRINGLRQAPVVGSRVSNIESAGGQTTMMPPGLRPPQEVLDAQALQSLPRPGVGQSGAPGLERGVAAQDISVNRAVDHLHKDLEKHRGGIRKRIGTEEAAYLNTPEGAVPQKIDSVIDRLQRRIESGTGSDGFPLPAHAIDADRKLLAEFQRGEYVDPGDAADSIDGDVPVESQQSEYSDNDISVQEARARGLPFDDSDIGKTAAERVGKQRLLMNPRTQSASDESRSVRVVREPKADPKGKGGPVYKTVDELGEEGARVNTQPMYRRQVKELEARGRVVVANREFTPQEIEGIIDRYQARLRRGNLRHDDVTAETELLPELYELRRNYGFNAAGPSPSGGYHGLKERHHGQMNKLEELYEAVGENPQLDVVNPNSKLQRQPLENFVRNLRKEGAPQHEKLPALVEYLEARPDLARKLDVAIANRDYDALRSGMEEPVRGMAQVGIPGKTGTRLGLTERVLKFLRLSVDPALQDLAGTPRGGRVPDELAPTFGDLTRKPAPDYFGQTGKPRDTVPKALGSSRAARVGGAVADDRDLSDDAKWLDEAVRRMWNPKQSKK